MKPTTRLLQIISAVLAGALLAGGSYALGSSSSSTTISGCVVNSSHELLIQKRCGHGQTRLRWNQQGPQGIQGNTGREGPPAATAWATIAPGPSAAVAVDGENIGVRQDGDGVFTLTASGSCTKEGAPSVVVTPSIGPQPSTTGIPVAYVVTPNGPGNVFEVVTGALSNAGAFTQGNATDFSVAVFCHQS